MPTIAIAMPSILEIIIHTRPLTLPDTLLLLIHLDHHPRPRRILRPLILPFLNKPRKPQTDTLPRSIIQRISPGFIPRTERQVRRLDFPHKARLEPDIRLILGNRGMCVKRLRFLDGDVAELGVKLFENGFREAGSDVAHRFVDLLAGIVAGEQEGAVNACSLALTVVRSQDDEIERIADAGQVVFFDFEPVSASFAWLVTALVRVKHLHHEPFAGRFDALIEKYLDLFQFAGVAVLGKGKLALHFGEGAVKELATLT